MQNTKTILIVEDNPTNLKLLRDILNYQKYDVLEATDGEMALQTIEKSHNDINLILMDLQLPKIGGLEVIKSIKSETKSQNIPIIVVSAHAMESDIKKCIEAGCLDYITKPINVQDFINRINSLFSK